MQDGEDGRQEFFSASCTRRGLERDGGYCLREYRGSAGLFGIEIGLIDHSNIKAHRWPGFRMEVNPLGRVRDKLPSIGPPVEDEVLDFDRSLPLLVRIALSSLSR
jgi:hypothetical protein